MRFLVLGHRALVFVLTAAAFFLAVGHVTAQVHFKQFRTKYLHLVYYDEDHAYVIPHLARCFENSLQFHMQLFDYTPTEPVTVLLQDFDDYGYAGTTTLPLNYLTLGIEPFEYVYETSPTNERINWVMSHELLHIVASDQASSMDRFFRTIFSGKVVADAQAPISMFYSYLTAPRRYAPRWYHEGMAVFMETWMAGGYGRALGGYDEMVFRTKVKENDYFYDVVGLESEGTTIDFQVGQVSYLYGTRFITYLGYQYGPEKVIRWLNRKNGSKAYFASQFKRVFATALDEEWERWIAWEHQWQQTNLDSIQQYPLTDFRPLSTRPLGSVSRAYYDSEHRKLYTAVNFPGQFAHLAEIDVDTWSIRKIKEVPTPALYYVSSVAYDDSSRTLFYTTDNSRQWRDLNAVDVETGKSRLLINNSRTGDLAFNRRDRSIWGVQHHNGFSRLVRIGPPYGDWFDIVTLPFGKDLFDIDISPDGKYLTGSLIEVTGRQRLIRMHLDELLAGGSGYDVLYEFPNNSPANFVFSADGRYLFGTSYYTGVSNVFRFDFEHQKMEAITNGETGFFRPVPVSEDSLIVFHYTAAGFVPVMIGIETLEDVSAIRFLGQAVVDEHPMVKEWMLGSPARINIDSLTTASGIYRPIKHIELSSIYPIVESYKDRTAFGLRLNFMEPVGLHGIDITASYTPNSSLPDDEKGHFSLRYGHWPWEISGTYNKGDFYDFFGPTKKSRKGYSGSIQYNNVIVNDKPRYMDYTLKVAGYGGLERLPEYQNVASSFDNYITAHAQISYKSVLKSIGGVEHEKGIKWGLNAQDNHVNSSSFPRIYGTFDYGFVLPLDHSSIWMRTALGHSRPERDEVFSNFYFGGFGNNWVDHEEAVKRYREYYSFPGIELNELGGTNFGKLLLEWTLPPVRFKRLGVPILYGNWAHLTMFSSAISTNYDNRTIRRTLANFGAQLDFKVVIFSALASTFSLGYAGAIEKNQRLSTEFMISLKIL